MLSPDGDAAHLEGKLVAHYHAGPLGATKVNSLKFFAPGSSNIRMLRTHSCASYCLVSSTSAFSS